MEENPEEGITEINKAIEYLVDKGLEFENEGLSETQKKAVEEILEDKLDQ